MYFTTLSEFMFTSYCQRWQIILLDLITFSNLKYPSSYFTHIFYWNDFSKLMECNMAICRKLFGSSTSNLYSISLSCEVDPWFYASSLSSFRITSVLLPGQTFMRPFCHWPRAVLVTREHNGELFNCWLQHLHSVPLLHHLLLFSASTPKPLHTHLFLMMFFPPPTKVLCNLLPVVANLHEAIIYH